MKVIQITSQTKENKKTNKQAKLISAFVEFENEEYYIEYVPFSNFVWYVAYPTINQEIPEDKSNKVFYNITSDKLFTPSEVPTEILNKNNIYENYHK